MEKTNSIPGSGTTGSMSSAMPTSMSGNAIQRGVDSTGSALHSGIDKVTEPVRSTVESLSASAHQTVESIASGAHYAADRFANETRKITEAPGKALDYSKACIQDRPLEAVGIALALGFIFGRLTAR